MTIELDTGLRFLTNFRYNIKPEISSNPVYEGAKKFSRMKTGDYKYFDSSCSETMIGFLQTMPQIVKQHDTMDKHKVVCFFGKQITPYDYEQTVQVKTEADDVKVAVITE